MGDGQHRTDRGSRLGAAPTKRLPDFAWLRSIGGSWAAIGDESTQRHLQSMGSMLAVQHTLHSQIDVPGIVQAVLDYARHIHPCDEVAVGLVDGSRELDLELFTSIGAARPGMAMTLTAEENTELRSRPGPTWISCDRGDRVPDFLGPMVEAGMRQTVVLPMLARERLSGVLALGRREQWDLDPEQLPYLMGFAEAAAIAFDNARSFKENELLAKYDVLTGLPNRRVFFDRLRQVLSAADRDEHLAAACFIDLDDFKRVNDTLGHAAGDRVLRQIAQRLVSCLRQSDSICRATAEGVVPDGDADESAPIATTEEEISRLGGDEFAVVLSRMNEAQDAGLVAKRVAAIFERPYEIDGHEVFLNASIGISVYPHDGRDADVLLRNADTAMYCAKKRGKNCFQYYTKSMNAEASRRLHIETRLRSALEREEFQVWYQQKRDVRSGRIVSAEALLRWDDPDMGMVSPAEFIPLAEQTGCICPIGEWALREVCSQAQTWRERGYAPIPIAVNISAFQLRQPDFVEIVAGILEETGMDPGQLEFEITETAIMGDDGGTEQTLKEFHGMGISLALDDFGTGYSSLSYLRRFALDRVKIDRSFVRELPANSDDRAVTEAIVAMAHGLRLRVVAEGVETEEQARYLREIGCDELQGFLFGRPVCAEEFEKTLDREKTEDGQ